MVAHTNGGLAASAVFGGEKADFDLGTFLGVADGVADDIFDGAAENFAVAGDGAGLRGDDANEAVAAAGFEIRVGDDVAQQRVEIYRALLHESFAAFQTGEAQEAADQAVQAFRFELDAIKS